MKGIRALFVSILLLSAPAIYAARSEPQSQESDASWQKEFDEVCSRTQDAMTMTVAELEAIIRRCDALEPRIEKLDETRRKIYLKRLKQCRGLYAYVLESKQNDKK